MKIGIIGGSGLDDPDILSNRHEIQVDTKFGKPSDALILGNIGDVDVVLLARHGRKHTIMPSKVNFRANIMTLKEQGCDCIIATSAVGSLREEIKRGDFVFLDQFIDFTRQRKISFFENFEDGIKHTPMAEPFDKNLRQRLINAAKKLNLRHHTKGTVITIEGPRFSTRAESNMFRLLGADVINMTIASEAVLANELKLPYAAIAMSTDFDSWKSDEKPVSWNDILEVLNTNAKNVTNLIIEVISTMR